MTPVKMNPTFTVYVGVRYEITLPSGKQLSATYLNVVNDAREPQYFVLVFELESIGDFNVTVGIHEKIVFHPDFGIKPAQKGGAA